MDAGRLTQRPAAQSAKAGCGGKALAETDEGETVRRTQPPAAHALRRSALVLRRTYELGLTRHNRRIRK